MTEEIWTVSKTMNWAQGYLERHGDPNPRLSAQLLMAHAANLSRIQVYTHFDEPLSVQERQAFKEAMVRRGTGEPIQYITESAPFWYVSLRVTPDVLIPRPETETLVDIALVEIDRLLAPTDSQFQDARAEVNVVDCCTGSGCIACALATERSGVSVVATDISEAALAIAQENVDALNVSDRVRLVQTDLLEGLEPQSAQIVVSNPPYIPDAVMAALPSEVADYEPHLALSGGLDGLDLFRRLSKGALQVLCPDGMLVCELHEDCLDQAAGIMGRDGYLQVRIHQDLTGRPRFVSGIRGA